MVFDSDDTEVKKQKEIDEFSGKLSRETEEDKLMHTILPSDEKNIEDGKVVNDAINKGISSFTPDLIFEQIVKNFSQAKKLYGETIIRTLSGYAEEYVEKNIRIPEFQRELKKRIKENADSLVQDGVLNKQYMITDKGVKLASLVLYVEELDHLTPKGVFGERVHKKQFIYGGKDEAKPFKNERYRDIAIKKSVKTAIRRGHSKLEIKDLKAYEREAKGQVNIMYGLDASGSMKGKKLETAKKAGIALAYKAIAEKDKVGLIVFGADVKEIIEPTLDFDRILQQITKIRASKETDIVGCIKKSIEIFPSTEVTKHLILLTDALQTVGTENEVLEATSIAREAGITISVVGINLDKKGKKLAKDIAELSNGRFYIVKDLENVDKIVLEDYYEVF
ncbi:VWA domain-containing protein [Nanoarchaeota archaeon]